MFSHRPQNQTCFSCYRALCRSRAWPSRKSLPRTFYPDQRCRFEFPKGRRYYRKCLPYSKHDRRERSEVPSHVWSLGVIDLQMGSSITDTWKHTSLGYGVAYWSGIPFRMFWRGMVEEDYVCSQLVCSRRGIALWMLIVWLLFNGRPKSLHINIHTA